jgi:hypothetical protein
MHTKIKGPSQEPVLVETLYERRQYRWGVVGAIAAILGTVIGVVALIDSRKPIDFGLWQFLSLTLLLLALLLMTVAGWLNLAAAKEWRRARSGQPVSTHLVGKQALNLGHKIEVGRKVRVKAHIPQSRKDAGPGWESQMDLYQGHEAIVTLVDKHGWVTLDAFPGCPFLQEWLDLLP